MAEDYIIEVLLRARDEASAKIDALQRKVDSLRASAAGRNATSDLEQGFDDLGRSAGDSADAVERHNVQQERLRSNAVRNRGVIDEHARSHDKAASSVDKHTQSQSDLVDAARRGEQAFSDQEGAMDDAESAAARFEKRLREVESAEEDVHNRFRGNNSTFREYSDGLKLISNAYSELSKRAKLGSEDADEMLARHRAVNNEVQRLGTQSTGGDLLKSYRDFDDSVKKGQLTLAESRRGYQNFANDFARISHSFDNGSDSALRFGRMADDSKARLAELSTGTKDFTTRLREVDGAQANLYSRLNSGKSSLRDFADGLSTIKQRLNSLAREAPLGSELAQSLLSRSRTIGNDARQFTSHASGQDLTRSYEDFRKAVSSGDVSTTEARRGFQSFETDFRKVSRSFEDGSFAAREFGRMADDAGKRLKNIPLQQASNDFERFVARISHAGDDIGIKIISLSASLRGLRLVGIVGFVQQLDTAVVGLAGGLFAMASSAAQAGAAIGGALLSGIAQAIPAIGVLALGVMRIKSVFDAAKLAQQIQQQKAFDPTQQAALQLQTSESLISAQQGLVDAYNNVTTAQIAVKQSQIELTQARIDAIRNLTDLTIAEKTAAEQAAGAKLSLIQAEQQLQTLEQTGGSQLQLQQAQLAVQEARTGVTTADIAVPRARQDLARARRLGVNGSLGVVSAEQSLRQAVLALTRAPVQLREAANQLRLAQMQAASPSGRETSTQGQLNYLTSQMNAPEKALFNSFTSLQTMMQSPSSPLRKLSDSFVAPFAQAMERIQGLLKNRSFMGDLDAMASALSKGFSKIFDPKGGGNFLQTMVRDATQNIPVVTRLITGLESVFMSLARAAAPALHVLLTDFAHFINLVGMKDASPEGQKHLTDFFLSAEKMLEHILESLRAFYDLLKALGKDAAPSGDGLFVGLTKSMDSATKWIQGHGPEVRKFFGEVVDVMKIIGEIFVSLGKVMIAVFDSSAMKQFGLFIDQFLLPAISDVANVIGFVMKLFMSLINLFGGPGRLAVEALAAAFVSMLVLNRVADAFIGATKGARALHAAMTALANDQGIKGALKAFADNWNGISTAAGGAAKSVKQATADTESALTNAQPIVAEKTAAIDADMIGMGTAAEKVPVMTGVAMTETEAKVVAAEPVLATEGAADGAAIGTGMLSGFARIFTPIAIVAILAEALKGPLNSLSQDIYKWTGGAFGSGASSNAGRNSLTSKQAWSDSYAAAARFGGTAQSYYKELQQSGAIQSSTYGISGSTDAYVSKSAPSGAQASPGSLISYLTSHGFSLNAAAGIAGNIGGAEDTSWSGAQIQGGGFASTPVAGQGFGLAQWTTSGRQAGLVALAKKMGLSPSDPRVQYAYIVQEINANPSLKSQLNAANSPASAAQIAALQYEGPAPATANYAGRQAAATAYAGGFGSTPGVGSYGGPGGQAAQPSGALPAGQKIYWVVGEGFVRATPVQYAAVVAEWKHSNPGKQYPTGPSSGSGGAGGSGDGVSNAGVGRGIGSAGIGSGTFGPSIPTIPSFLGVNPSNTIQLTYNFFKSVRDGLSQLSTSFERIRSVPQQITDFVTYASNAFLTFQNLIQSNVTQLQTRLADVGINAGYRTISSSNTSWQGLQRRPTGIGDVVSRGVGAGDTATIVGAENYQQALGGEMSFLRKMISEVRNRIRQTNLIKNASQRKAALTKLDTTYAQYETALTGVGDQMAQNIQTIYQDEQQAVQDELTRVSNKYQTQQAGLQAQQSGAQSMGRFDLLPAIDEALANSAKKNISALQDALAKAQEMGDTTTAAQIKQQIDQLRGSIAQFTAQALSDAISAVQQAGQNASGMTSLLTGLASVATSQGNFQLAGRLSASAYRNAISSDATQISAYAGSGANLTAIAAGNYSSVGSGSLLSQALSSGNAGAVTTILQALDGLGVDLATNTQALVDNTAATDDATAQFTQARGQFVSGVYSGLGSIVQAAGTATGQLDLPAMMATYQGSNRALQGANQTLAGTLQNDFGINVAGMSPTEFASTISALNIPALEATMSPAQVTEFEDLINALSSNNQTIENNTIAINTLNGQLTQPQSFTSSAFASFRDAIFTGMGGLNPNYATPLGVSNPTTPGLAGTGAPGQTVQHIAVTTNPMAVPVDASTVGQQLAFGIKVPHR